jgi:T5SS/PEP-CTERM-associated repeat protein
MTSYIWKSGNGVFTSSANWTPAGVPGPGDTATISGGVAVTDPAALDLAGLTLGRNTSLTLASGGDIISGLTVSAGGVLSDTNSATYLTLNGAPQSAAFSFVSSGGEILSNDAGLAVGNTGSAFLAVDPGGLVSAAKLLDIAVNAGGQATVLISGGTVEYGTNLYVGNTSGTNGVVDVLTSGSLLGIAPPGGTSGEALIGVNAGATGDVTVSGPGAVFDTDGNPIIVGLAGSGDLFVMGGAQVGQPLPRTRRRRPFWRHRRDLRHGQRLRPICKRLRRHRPKWRGEPVRRELGIADRRRRAGLDRDR